MHPVLQVAAALIPSIGVGAIFWYAVRTMIQADRRERLAMARLDAEEAQRDAGAQPQTATAARTSSAGEETP